MRIDADAGKGELGHVRAADQDATRRAQPSHDGSLKDRRRGVVKRLRARKRALARYVEQILQRNRQSGERRGDITGLAQPVLCVGCTASAVAIDLDKGAHPFAGGIGDLRERRFDQFATGRAPIYEISGDA